EETGLPGLVGMVPFQLLPEKQAEVLRQQMLENQASYQHKLQSSQEAQHRQAILVQKLQAKVLQYRNWCKELEQRLEMGRVSLICRKRNWSGVKFVVPLLFSFLFLRCENLAEVNTLLREHLDKANEVNEALREDVSKLMADWTRARDELERKESEWHTEREFFERHLRAEHDRLLGLWRQVMTFRCHFLEMKTATDRDLSELKAEQMKLSGSILVSCSYRSSGTQLWGTSILQSPILRDERQQQLYAKGEEVEKDINRKTQEVMHLQVTSDTEKEELQARVLELSALLEHSQKQNEEKEKTVKTLSDTMEILVAA
uniref:Rootletin-like coiled-coil domain-containing protein n=1 Tax=Sphenodon punctatus TaxID=8508 RepID=A0A8D0GY93_SPHPU